MLFRLLCILSVFLFWACGGDQYEPYNPPTGDHKLLYNIKTIDLGDTCELGGTEINMGFDINDDGILSDNEITTTKDICNTQNDIAFQVTPIDKGDECTYGGVSVKVGIDLNGDGIIDGPILKQFYICNEPGPIDKPIISVSYDNSSSLCKGGKIKIKNETKDDVSVKLVSNGNVHITGFRNGITPAYPQKPYTFPMNIKGGEEIDFNLNIQPDKEGDVDVLYAVSATKKDGITYTYTDLGTCFIGNESIENFTDIATLKDFFISSYVDNSNITKNCQRGKECFFGIPYGIRKGLYPLSIKLDWGDGRIDEKILRNLDNQSIFSHIYEKKGNLATNISIKTENQNEFLSAAIHVNID